MCVCLHTRTSRNPTRVQAAGPILEKRSSLAQVGVGVDVSVSVGVDVETVRDSSSSSRESEGEEGGDYHLNGGHAC